MVETKIHFYKRSAGEGPPLVRAVIDWKGETSDFLVWKFPTLPHEGETLTLLHADGQLIWSVLKVGYNLKVNGETEIILSVLKIMTRADLP